MEVAAVILNWRRPEDTIRCALSVAGSRTNLDIIVCDNDSGDGSLEVIHAALATSLGELNDYRLSHGLRPLVLVPPVAHHSPDSCLSPTIEDPVICLVQTRKNGGYAFGNNIGIRYALARPSVQYAWILNNDTVVDPDAARHLLERMRRTPASGICGATVYYLHEPDTIQAAAGGTFNAVTGRCRPLLSKSKCNPELQQFSVERSLHYINGACALVSRQFFETVGPMCEDYFLYYEEIDWATRGRDFSLAYAPLAKVYHQVGASIGTSDTGSGSALSVYYLNRSRMKFLWRHSKLSIAFSALDILKDALRDASRGHFRVSQTRLRALFNLRFAQERPRGHPQAVQP